MKIISLFIFHIKFFVKDLLAKIIRLGFRKSSGLSNDGSQLAAPAADDETDTEFHESLPEDVLNKKEINIGQKLKNAIKSTRETFIKKKIKSTDSDEKQEQKLSDDNKKTHKGTISHFADKAVDLLKKKKEEERNESENADKKQYNVKIEPTPIVTKEEKDDQKGGQFSRRSSEENRHDSITSIIPVITISKTESDENILEKNKRERSVAKPEDKKEGSFSDSNRRFERQSSVESSRSFNFPY